MMKCNFLEMFSMSRLSKVKKGILSLPPTDYYDQEVFRCLLESESHRSERSGYMCQVLLLYRVDAVGRVVQIDSHIAKKLMAVLSHSLRETDYVGWYCDGRIVGAILTVLVKEHMTQVVSDLQKRLVEALQFELSIEESNCLRVRVCLHDELERIGLDESLFC